MVNTSDSNYRRDKEYSEGKCPVISSGEKTYIVFIFHIDIFRVFVKENVYLSAVTGI